MVELLCVPSAGYCREDAHAQRQSSSHHRREIFSLCPTHSALSASAGCSRPMKSSPTTNQTWSVCISTESRMLILQLGRGEIAFCQWRAAKCATLYTFHKYDACISSCCQHCWLVMATDAPCSLKALIPWGYANSQQNLLRSLPLSKALQQLRTESKPDSSD